MSNYLAVATVTATLHNLLLNAASVVAGATVATKRPDSAPVTAPTINVFLYQVAPNAAYRNGDLPTRRSDGALVCKPQAALTLNYLLSFVGEESKLEPQRLLGAAVRFLHAQPALQADDIKSTISNPPFESLLGGSTLADQVDRVRFTPLNLSLDELSKIWSVFFQTPYSLSVAYQASAVLIEAEDEPRVPLPVLQRNLYPLPLREPHIERVSAATGDADPIVAKSTIVIRGTQLRGQPTEVLIGGASVAAKSVAETTIEVTLPATLRAGVHPVQIMHPLLMGNPPVTHAGFDSNVVTFALQPRIINIKHGTVNDNGSTIPALRVRVDVTIGKTQRLVLIMNGVSGSNPPAYRFTAPERTTDADEVVVATPGVRAGKYFVRLQVDGASSVLDLIDGSPTFGPVVTMP